MGGGSPSRPVQRPVPSAWLSLLYPVEDETRAVAEEGGREGRENLAMGCGGRGRERFYYVSITRTVRMNYVTCRS